MRIQENLWWLIFGAFWTVFAVVSLFLGEFLLALLAAMSLASLLLYARTTAVLRRTVRHKDVTIASLERALKEAHRRDLR